MRRTFLTLAAAMVTLGLAACSEVRLERIGPTEPGPPPTFASCATEPGSYPRPPGPWQDADPADGAWDLAQLKRRMDDAADAGYAAGMIVHRGRVVASFGDTTTPYGVRSIRKSLLNALVGQLVAERAIHLDATLEELGIDDVPALMPKERKATVRDLLGSRSGIYRESAYSVPGGGDEMPARGEFEPGEHFYYNNWDFNALGSLVLAATNGKLFSEFHRRIAAPIGMEDYRGAGELHYESVSTHPAYLFNLSTRDRARFGLLYLHEGCWEGKQVVPRDWVEASLAPQTNRDDEMDYGYLWWSQEAPQSMGLSGRMIMARGNGNQYITIIPELDLVLVLTTDLDRPGYVNWFRRRTGALPEFEDYVSLLAGVVELHPDQK